MDPELIAEIKKINSEQPVSMGESAYETKSKHERIMALLGPILRDPEPVTLSISPEPNGAVSLLNRNRKLHIVGRVIVKDIADLRMLLDEMERARRDIEKNPF